MRLAGWAVWLLGSVAVAADPEQTWPAFRGPLGNGVALSKTAPIRWSETEGVRWKTFIHGKGWSSPVVWGRRIWMTTATPDGKELFAVCLDREDGRILWDRKVFDVPRPAFCHPFNSYASPTPVVEPGRVYVHYGSAGTACLDSADGRILWERRDLPCDHYRGAGSSPILWNDLLILTFDGFDQQYLAALDKQTGRTVWKKSRDILYSTSDGDFHKAFSTPAVVTVGGKPELISPAAEATFAYDPATGNELWRVVHGGMNVSSRPVFGHGLIYLTSGHTAHLLAVRQGQTALPGQATTLSEAAIAWKVTRGVPTRSSLLLAGDYLFMVSDQGVASCLEARTGKTCWQKRLGGGFSASPVHCNGCIYFADEEGKTHVVRASPEFELLAVNQLEQGCLASPAIVEGALYLRTRTHLYRIEAAANPDQP